MKIPIGAKLSSVGAILALSTSCLFMPLWQVSTGYMFLPFNKYIHVVILCTIKIPMIIMNILFRKSVLFLDIYLEENFKESHIKIQTSKNIYA